MANNFLFNSKKSKNNPFKSQRQLKVGEELRHLISNALLRSSFYDENIKKSSNNFKNQTLQLHCFQLIFSLSNGKIETVQAELRGDMQKNITSLGMYKYIPKLGKNFQYEINDHEK